MFLIMNHAVKEHTSRNILNNVKSHIVKTTIRILSQTIYISHTPSPDRCAVITTQTVNDLSRAAANDYLYCQIIYLLFFRLVD